MLDHNKKKWVRHVLLLLLFSHPVVSNFLQLMQWILTQATLGDSERQGGPVCYIGDAIQPSHPLTPSSSSTLDLSQHQGLFQWVICSHQMTKILEFQLQHHNQWIFRDDLIQDWLLWPPCCPRDFQESSPAPQFEGINSLAFCFLYVPFLTTKHDHWKDHSLDYTNLCLQSTVSAFQHPV